VLLTRQSDDPSWIYGTEDAASEDTRLNPAGPPGHDVNNHLEPRAARHIAVHTRLVAKRRADTQTLQLSLLFHTRVALKKRIVRCRGCRVHACQRRDLDDAGDRLSRVLGLPAGLIASGELASVLLAGPAGAHVMGEVLRETRRQIRKAQDHSARPGVAPEAAAVKHNHTAITAISLAAIPLTVLGPMTQVYALTSTQIPDESSISS
jgi:hypothetical protein